MIGIKSLDDLTPYGFPHGYGLGSKGGPEPEEWHVFDPHGVVIATYHKASETALSGAPLALRKTPWLFTIDHPRITTYQPLRATSDEAALRAIGTLVSEGTS